MSLLGFNAQHLKPYEDAVMRKHPMINSKLDLSPIVTGKHLPLNVILYYTYSAVVVGAAVEKTR